MHPSRPSPVRLLAVTSLTMVTAISACTAGQGKSLIKHDYNTPTRDGDTWNWRAATDSDYATLMAPLLGLDAASILPTDSPQTQRAQLWLDRIDAYVRGAHPTELANVPKPQAKVLRNAVPNAFVAPIPSCYSVPVQLPGASGNAAKSVDAVFVDVKTGAVEAWPAQFQCKDGTATQSAADTISQFVAHFNANSAACQLSVGASGGLVVGDSCAVDPQLQGVTTASSLVIMQTANFVTVHSGIMPIMTEAQFVAVLAHELGHYYRSHLTAPASLYDYFYTLQPTEQSHKPTPEPGQAQLGQAAIASSGILDADDNFTAVAGQKLSSQLYFTVGTLVTQIGASQGASSACTSAASLLTSSSFTSAIGRFPFSRVLTAAQLDAYASYETAALACLQTVPLGDGGVAWQDVKTAAAGPSWPAWLGSIPASSQGQLQRILATVAARLGDSATATNLGDAFVQAAQTFATQDQQSIQVLDQFHAQHIGQYTIEQEADDESGEWIADMGFNPENEVDAMRALGKGAPASLHGEVLAQSDCETLWNQHWLDAQGNYTYIAVGDLTDPHHSICYRMFNIERDVAAHNEQAAAVAVPTHDDQSWSDVQANATQLTTASLSVVGAAPNAATTPATSTLPLAASKYGRVSPLVQRTGAMSCTYSYSYH